MCFCVGFIRLIEILLVCLCAACVSVGLSAKNVTFAHVFLGGGIRLIETLLCVDGAVCRECNICMCFCVGGMRLIETLLPCIVAIGQESPPPPPTRLLSSFSLPYLYFVRLRARNLFASASVWSSLRRWKHCQVAVFRRGVSKRAFLYLNEKKKCWPLLFFARYALFDSVHP